MLDKAGVITKLKRQVYFVLQDKYVNNKGEKIQEIRYKADFTYIRDGKKIVEDVKSVGTRTKVFIIKKKMFEKRYPDWIFIES